MLQSFVSQSGLVEKVLTVEELLELPSHTATANLMMGLTFDEGQLEWHELKSIDQLEIPSTDRHVIWPLFQRYRGSFFTAHINLGNGEFLWRIEQPAPDATDWRPQGGGA